MRIITLNDITLDYSSVPEDQYNGSPTLNGLYNAGTSYAADDIIYYTATTPHTVYKSLDNSNLNNTPPDNPEKWGDLGATDRWRMFDQYVNTQTTDSTPLEVTVDASSADSIALFNLTGSSVQLTHIIDNDLADSLTPSFGTGWSDDAGNTEYDCNGSQTATSKLAFNIETLNEFYYEIQFTIQNYSAGNVAPYVNNTIGTYVGANGTYTAYVLADGSSDIGIIADADFVGSIDYTLSIKLCGKRETVSLLDSRTTGWYDYFNTPLSSTNRVLWSFPKYLSATVKVQISGTSDVGCGILAVGTSNNIGDTEYNPDFGISDYSYKNTDSDTGNTNLQQGNFADEGSFDLWLTYSQIDFVKNTLISARGTPAIYDFNNEDTNDPYLVFYGFYEKFRITIPSYRIARCALDIQGLI